MAQHDASTVDELVISDPAGGRILRRPRLEAFLDVVVEDATAVPLALVCAGPGFGKTTLVRSWCERQDQPVVYVSFQGLHPGPTEFWRTVLRAMRRADDALASAVKGLTVPDRASETYFAVELADALASQRFLLVLDDLHSVVDARTLTEVEHLLRRLPSAARTILMSRSEPPLPLVQDHRISGTMHQLGSARLAFTPDEVAEVCAELDSDHQRLVFAQTEGWPAMVRLMLVALRDGLPVSEIWEREAQLFDYLFAEVFKRRDDAAQDVLLMSSLADPVPLAMVVELTGQGGAGTTLDQTARHSGLITRGREQGGDVTYHLHPILRAFLGGELLRRDLTAARRAHLEAAHWFLRHGDGLRAVQQAVRSGDPDGVEDVLCSTGLGLVNEGRSERLVALLSEGPLRSCGPWESVITAAALLDLGRVSEAAARLEGLPSATLPEGLGAIVGAARCHLAQRAGEPPTTSGSDSVPGEQSGDVRLFRALHEGAARMRLGQLDEAQRDFTAAVQLAEGLERPAALVDSLTMLTTVSMARSDIRRITVRSRLALEAAEQSGWARSRRAALSHVHAGWAARQSLDDLRARHHANLAGSLVDDEDDPTTVLGVHALQAATSFQADEGAPADAHRLHDLWRLAEGRFVTPQLVVYAGTADAHFSLSLGRTDRLRRISTDVRQRLGDTSDTLLVEALHELGRGHRRLAGRQLREVLDATPVVPITHVEALSLSARLCLEEGDEFAARQCLERALDLASGLGTLRPLIDAGGSPVTSFLRDHRGGWGHLEDVVDRLVQYAGSPPGLEVALTERELAVLRQLPTMMTLEEIAASMLVSVNTVKTHLRNVYRKLDVPSRRDAVTEARRWGLL